MREQQDEARILSESLRVCQEELARVRSSQEELMEELALERQLRAQVEKQSGLLADAVTRKYLALPAGSGLSTRVRRRVSRRRMATAAEWQDAATIEQSDYFSAAWYLLRYPDVVESGLPPALHYIRIGAREGKDPSEHFSTRSYVRAHPEVRESATNPLVHYLRTDRFAARGR